MFESAAYSFSSGHYDNSAHNDQPNYQDQRIFQPSTSNVDQNRSAPHIHQVNPFVPDRDEMDELQN